MFQVDSLVWTSRAAVCEQLSRFVLETAPQPGSADDLEEGDWSAEDWEDEPEPEPGSAGVSEERAHDEAAYLLACLAEPSCAPALRRVALNQEEWVGIRIDALRALARLQVSLPPSELAELLADRTLWEDEEDGFGEGRLRHWIALFRSEEAQQIAREAFERLSPDDRMSLLWDFGHVEECVPAELMDWLYNCWLHENQFSTPGDRRRLLDDAALAAATLRRRPSREILIDCWRRASGEDRWEILADMREYPEDLALAVAENPAELREAAEALALPHAELIRYFGRERLLHVIAERLRPIASHLRSSERGDWFGDRNRALDRLREWPDAGIDGWICSLISSHGVDYSAMRDVLDIVWSRSPSLAIAEALRAQWCAECLFPIDARLQSLASDPGDAEIQDLLWTATRHPLSPWRYLAVRALELRGEDGARWRERLGELSRDPDPLVRLQAAGALARRGDRQRHAEIVRDATEGPHVCVRAEAVRILGELDAERHFGILRDALMKEARRPFVERHSPAAEEAACALMRLRTMASLTALLQAYFVSRSPSLCEALEGYFVTIAAELDGRTEPIGTDQITSDRAKWQMSFWRRDGSLYRASTPP